MIQKVKQTSEHKYEVLDYIENTLSSNTDMSYINTRFRPTYNTRLEFKFFYPADRVIKEMYGGVLSFGCMAWGSSNRTNSDISFANIYWMNFGYGSGKTFICGSRIGNNASNYYPWGQYSRFIQDHQDHMLEGTISTSSFNMNVDGTSYSLTPVSSGWTGIDGTVNTVSELYLFTGIWASIQSDPIPPSTAVSSRCYYFKIYDNDVLVRNFIPVKRLSDNEIGMYDTVNEIFYGSESQMKFIGTSKSTPEYIDETTEQTVYVKDIMLNGSSINRIYNDGSIYWGNAPATVPHHKIEGTLSSSFSSIYFDRQITAPGSSSFTGGYAVPVMVNGNDWYVDTTDAPQTLVGCFANNNNITSVSIYNLDCTNLNSIENMFEYCQYMTSCDVSRLDTSNVTVMGNIFGHCTRLESVDLSSWDFSKVQRCWGMLRDLSAMTSIDLSGCNFSSVLTAMDHLFYNSRSLETIDLSNQNFSGVSSMNYVFYNCTGLKTLYLLDMQVHSGLTFGTSMWSGCSPTDVYINNSTVLNKFTNNLSSQGPRYIPSSATIHYNGTDYKWQNSAWTPQN